MKYSNETYLSIFSDCKLTKGAIQTLVVDVTRGKTFIIDNDAYDFLVQCKTRRLNDVISDYKPEEHEFVIELINYLIGKDLCFLTTTPASFPELSEQWDSPSHITNAIIDVDEKWHNFERIIPQLTDLGCYDIQVRCFSAISAAQLEELIMCAHKSSIKSIELYLKSDKSLTKSWLKELTKRFFKIKNLIIHSHPKNEAYIIYSQQVRNNMGNIVFIQQQITDETHCGVVSPHYFAQDNLQFFNESKQFNSCLNRKLSIDKYGEIKNCPSLPQSYGNVTEVTLQKAFEHQDFKTLWGVTKDQIKVCKDCEYRNVCSDCRAYTQNADDPYAKPAKCGYNPYEGKWEKKAQKALNLAYDEQ